MRILDRWFKLIALLIFLSASIFILIPLFEPEISEYGNYLVFIFSLLI